MNEVGAIRSVEELNNFKREAQRLGPQPHLLVLLGLNTGLRIGDLLKLRVSDIRDRGYILLWEQKTGKQKEMRFHPSVVADIRRMTADRDGNELLFPSTWLAKRGKPISYKTAYGWVTKAARRAGINGLVGCHTLRKTYGYHFYKQYHDIATLMKIFNHSSEDVTMRYIGVTQESINAKTEKFRL